MLFRKKMREKIQNSFGKNPLEDSAYYDASKRLSEVRRFYDALSAGRSNHSDHTNHPDHTEHPDHTDHPERGWLNEVTWEDLEMDQVFLRVNHTHSFIGEQVLFAQLHRTPAETETFKSEAEKKERRLDFWKSHEKERTDAALRLMAIGKSDCGYFLIDFLQNTALWTIGKTWVYHLLQILFIVSLVLGIALDSRLLIGIFIAVALVNLSIYIYTKNKYDIYFDSLMELKRVYDFVKWMAEKDPGGIDIPPEVKASLKDLRGMSHMVLNLEGKRQALVSGDILGLVTEYLWGVLLIDVSMFNHILKIIGDKEDRVICILNFAGQVDAELSVVSYRESIEVWCRPEFAEGGILARGLVHPLIADPVPNDFELRGRAILTGTNASGKSTFMKSLTVNCILAQTINTCTARRFETAPRPVSSCMALRDNVLTGESYYFREASCLKEIVDRSQREPGMLVVIDEILKGTNSAERVAAAGAILDYLAKTDCLALVATHDAELTGTAGYENYYFSSRIEYGKIQFDYRIHEGRNAGSNAIDLLAFLHYPPEIVAGARANLK